MQVTDEEIDQEAQRFDLYSIQDDACIDIQSFRDCVRCLLNLQQQKLDSEY